MSLDFYCERTSAEFWAEPINAWSNLSFVLVGIWNLWRLKNKSWSYSHTLSALCTFVGVGSFLFHTFANRLTHLADLLPIFIFTLIFIYFSFTRVLRLPTKTSWILSVLFVFTMILIEIFIPKSILNGSLLYAPALLALLGIGLKADRGYLPVAGIFTISLVARTLDHSICEVFPMGTHFLWHLSNAVALALMIRISVRKIEMN